VTTIPRDLPYFDDKSAVVVQNRAEAVKRQQIVVWISLAKIEERELLPGTPRFPAVLDTGFWHNFGIREDLLRRWAGMQPGYLPRGGDLRVNNVTVPCHDADVWLYRNQPGQRDQLEGRPPFCLELNQGIAVYPAGAPNAPRLPVLGLRALKWTGLHFSIDSDQLRVWLRTRRRFRLFG
jgi:hypothetical protein